VVQLCGGVGNAAGWLGGEISIARALGKTNGKTHGTTIGFSTVG